MSILTTEATEAHRGVDRVYAGAATLAFGAVYAGARVARVSDEALRQRRGEMPACASPCLWLHGASAGEMAAASNLVRVLRDGGLSFAAAYTTTNQAGLQLIERRLSPGDVAALAPWDAPRWVARACDAWQPAALLLIETELWPGLIRAAAERGIAVVCASARIYPRDVARYRLIRRWLQPTCARIAAVLAQSDAERARFVDLGVPAWRCAVVGNLKHALGAPADGDTFRRAVGLGAEEPLVVFGSLHADEVDFVADAVTRAGARSVLAPRHADGVRASEQRGWGLARRSHGVVGDWDVLVLDTIGELAAAYAAATVAVVGGSFAAHGGHDLIEPLRAGAPVLFGARTDHVAEADALRAADSSAVVTSPGALADRLRQLLADPLERRALHDRQCATLPSPDAIATRYLQALTPILREPLCTSVVK